MIQHHFEEEVRRLESLIDAMMLINPNQIAHIKKKQIDFKFTERPMVDFSTKTTTTTDNHNNNNNNNNNILKSPKHSSSNYDGLDVNNSNNNNNNNNNNNVDDSTNLNRSRSDDGYDGNKLSVRISNSFDQNDGNGGIERSQSMEERGDVD